jgi:hypothetical protein
MIFMSQDDFYHLVTLSHCYNIFGIKNLTVPALAGISSIAKAQSVTVDEHKSFHLKSWHLKIKRYFEP